MTIFSRCLRALVPALAVLTLPAAAQDNRQPAVQPEAVQAAVNGRDITLERPRFLKPADPWIYRGTDIPVDEAWLMGEMPNGLRYAVRSNDVPPGQVSMRVLIDAGSLHERDEERGFAHLVEHLIFRESRDFGNGEAIPYFQRLGASLGNDTNATTSPTQTVYKLDLPNARPAVLVDSVRLFSGMIREPALSTANLAAEIPIVLAERREQAGTDRRIAEATRQVLFAGQRLANRSPIGTVETLQGATQDAVRAFHQRWYRPENAVVVMVGDADAEVLAALVEQYFGDWQVAGEPEAAPHFGDPAAPAGADPANPVGETLVIVEPGQPRNLTYGIMRPWVGVVDNIAYNQENMIGWVAQAIINRRLEAKARTGGTYLYATVGRDKVSRSVDGTFVTFTPIAEDWREALADVREVIADALDHAPGQQEIDRELAEFDVVFVNMLEQARIQAGSQLADEIVGAVDIREAVASPETFLSVFRDMRARFTPQAVLEKTHMLFSGNVIRAVLLTPQADDSDADDLRAALLAPVSGTGNSRDQGAAISFADLPEIGTPAGPVSIEPLGAFEVEKLTFANGVRVLLRPTDNEPGRATVRVRFGSGWQGFAPDEGVYANLGRAALINSGQGPLGQDELDRLATGRKFSFGFAIEEGRFLFEGQTRREDVADQLYLLAAKLAMPRWDVAPVERAKASAVLAYERYGNDPGGILNRDLDWLLRNRDPRFATATPDQMRAATARGFRDVWSRLLAEGPVEVAVFGDIDRDQTIAALARTFGALPPRQPLQLAAGERALGFPAANGQPEVLTHTGEAEQAAAAIAWPTGGGSDGLPQSRKLDLLAQIFANRLLDGMRERVGASYAPYVGSQWPLDVAQGGTLLALAQLQPVHVATFFDEADDIARDLAENGPTQDELARVTEPMRQYLMRAQTGHTFWLNNLEGAAFDPNRVTWLATLGSDLVGTTADEIRALAQRYLLGHGGYRLAVLPQEGVPQPGVVGR